MNVILIISDTLRRDFLGCYGNNWVHTENIDRFAKDAIIFDNAYAGSFPTVPNRLDVFTGKFTFTYRDWAPLPQNEVVLAEVLNKAGYMTMMIADTPHILKDGYNFQRGFYGWEWIRGQENDRFNTDPIDIKFPCDPKKLRNPYQTVVHYLRNTYWRRYESDYFVAQTMETAIKWLERNYRHERFFLYVDTFDPHEPWDPPRWYVDMYDPGYEGEEIIYPRYGPADYLTKEELRHMRALYAGEVTMVDRWVGRLLAKIEDLGLFDNTAIIFTTDHGFYHGEHNLTGKSIILEEKNYHGLAPLYEEVAHIPLIIKLPKAKGGRRCKAFVQPPDIMPTILDLLNVEDPGTTHGRSFLPIIKGEKKSIRDFAITSPAIIYGPTAGQRITVTTDEWRLIYAGNPEAVKEPSFTSIVDGIQREQHPLGEVKSELYHIKEDPRETVNLIDEHRDIAIEIHRRLIEFLKSIGTQEKYLKFWDKI